MLSPKTKPPCPKHTKDVYARVAVRMNVRTDHRVSAGTATSKAHRTIPTHTLSIYAHTGHDERTTGYAQDRYHNSCLTGLHRFHVWNHRPCTMHWLFSNQTSRHRHLRFRGLLQDPPVLRRCFRQGGDGVDLQQRHLARLNRRPARRRHHHLAAPLRIRRYKY